MKQYLYLLVGIICIQCGQQKTVDPIKAEKELATANEIMKEEPKETNYPGWLNVDFIMGQFDPATHEQFDKIPNEMSNQAGRYMQKDALQSFKKMFNAAKANGINLKVVSATRNFGYQKGIWERKWNGSTLLEGKTNAAKKFTDFVERAIAILRYSSMPGSSRHHWGTDIDINAFNNAYFESGKGLKEFEWLNANASKFGFCRPYTTLGSDRDSGYQEEKWHWSYTPVSTLCTSYAKEHLENSMIKGFLGSETAEKIDIKNNYILGISSKCK